MKKYLFVVLLAFINILVKQQAIAQVHKKDSLTLLAVSGFGYSFTSSKINEVLKPRFSSSLGFDLSSTKTNFFLLGAFDVPSFGYYQQYTEKAQQPYQIKNGNSTFYLLEITPGYRKKFGHVGINAYLGPGFGLINLPNAEVNLALQTATVVNNYSWTASSKAGLGIDYSVGDFVFFAQANVIHNFRKVQSYTVNTFPAYIGVKTNITGLFDFF